MEVKVQSSLILTTSLAMVFVLLAVDVYKVIALPFSGATHWIPESLAVFLFSNYLAEKFTKFIRWTIYGCVSMFPIIAYSFSSTGMVTSAFFSSVMLIGFLSVDVSKYLKKGVSSNNAKIRTRKSG